MSHDHYFRDVEHLKRIDVYRLLELFGVTCPVAQHVIKKAFAAGQRGHKDLVRDWKDIGDSAARKLQMIDEDLAGIEKACGMDRSVGIPIDLEPAVIANAAAFNGDWPNEQRRAEADDVTIWPRQAVGADVAFPGERALYFAATPGEKVVHE